MSTSEDVPRPPEAPEIRRRIHLGPLQWIGLPLLFLIPVLAVFGVFGERPGTTRDRTSELAVEIQYPTRYRSGMLSSLRVDVTNTTLLVLDTVTMDLDTAYLSRFSSLAAIPDFDHPYLIELTDLEPGETRRVRLEFQGARIGRHTGELRVSARGADTARVRLSTFVFP